MKAEKNMDCRLFLEQLDELLAGELPVALRRRMEAHAAECPACAEALRSARRALETVTPQHDIPVPEGLETRLMDTLRRQAATQSAAPTPQTAPDAPAAPRRAARRRWIGILSGALSAAAVIALALTVGLNTPARAARNSFMQAVTSMEGVRSIRIELRIRTTASEHFDYTNPLDEFVPHTLEAVYTPQLLWRIEKPGRKVLCDGRHVYQWLDTTGDGMILPCSSGAPGMLKLLIDPSQLLLLEQQLTRSHDGSRYDLRYEGETLHLTVTSPAQGDFSESDYLRNSSILESDTRREYRFDAASGRLTGARVTFLAGGRKQTLLEIDRIEYDVPLDTASLTRLPEGITWTDYTRPMQAGRLAGIDAVQAGRMILEAFATWDEAILDEALYSYGAGARELLKKRYAGARVTELGKPFRSGKYAGVFIPCTLRMADGSTEKIRLALRNDNSEQRWLVDGGL